MAEIITFRPKFKTPADNLAELIAHCRDNIALYEDQGGFGVDEWKTTHKRQQSIRFSIYDGGLTGKQFTPLPDPYALIAKSYVRYKQHLNESSAISVVIVGLQAVCEALIAVHRDADILKIDGLVQRKVVEILDTRYPGSDRLAKYGGGLVTFYEFLREKGVAPALPMWKRPGHWKRGKSKAERTDPESRKWQEKRCPSMQEMLCLADCFYLAEKPQDLYWSSVCTLLMFAPARGSEPFVLTLNCIGQETDGSYYVSWHSRKGFGATKKWVPTPMVEPVKEAVRRLTEISKPARDAVQFAYQNPGKFMRHPDCTTPAGFPEDKPLNFDQFCAAMNMPKTAKGKINRGLKETTAWNQLAIATKWVKKILDGGPITYRRLAALTLEKYKGNDGRLKKDWPNLPDTDRPIWESLLLIRDNEFHADIATKLFSWDLPDVNRLNDQLGKRVAPTLFERFGLKDENGGEIYMSSHQPRVWLSTQAERGGMDDWRLARWAGRVNLKDNRHYNMMTRAEYIEKSRAVLGLETAPTALEAAKMKLPVTYESLGIDRIGVAVPTLWGMCVFNFAESPCRKAGDCMLCKDHVCIKGLPNTLERLKLLENHVATSLTKAKDAAGSGIFGADRWVTHLGWKLAHISTQIKRLEDPNVPDGAVLLIPPAHDPSPVKRALEARGHNTDMDTDSPDKVELSELRKLMGF
ncbi:MAG: hypothetical protein CVU69_04940 [Deltaproteobacteria bacterium HGW-Deltaproteobacteria-4]|nr:MAG: hypothetical protein CVU69_04940 [Deltaproteobacteria bacterium HGW-Deltaproteobacteria-4]